MSDTEEKIISQTKSVLEALPVPILVFGNSEIVFANTHAELQYGNGSKPAGSTAFLNKLRELNPNSIETIRSETSGSVALTLDNQEISFNFETISWGDKSAKLLSGTPAGHLEHTSHSAGHPDFETLAEYLPYCIFKTDTDGNIISANQAAIRKFSFLSTDSVPNLPFLELIAPSDRSRARTSFRKVQSGAEIQAEEYTVMQQEGRVFQGMVFFRMLSKDEMQCFITDKSSSGDYDAYLNDPQGFFRMLSDNVKDGVFVIQKGKLLYANQAFSRLLGYTVDDLLGLEMKNVIAPEDYQLVIDRYSKRIAGNEPPQEYEFRMLKKDGRTRVQVKMRVGLIQYQGEPTSVGTLNNVTDKRRAEENLKTSEATLLSIFRAAPIGIGSAVNRVVKNVNNSICRMTGYSQRDLLNRSIRMLYTSDDEYYSAGKVIFERIRLYGKGAVETKWKTKSGQIIKVRLNVVLIDQKNWKKGTIFTVEDITDQKTVERELQKKSEFERQITTISTRLINLPPAEILDEMDQVLGEIGRFIGADRAFVFQFQNQNSEFSCIAEWARNSLEPFGAQFQRIPVEMVKPWYDNLSESRSHIITNHTGYDLAQGTFDLLNVSGIRSALEIPVFKSDSLIGVLGLGYLEQHNMWNQEDIRFLKTVSEIIANSLDRKSMEQELMYRSQFEGLISEISTLLINLPLESIEEHIEWSLGEICRFCKSEAGIIFLADSSRKTLEPSYFWCESGYFLEKSSLTNIDVSNLAWWQSRQDEESSRVTYTIERQIDEETHGIIKSMFLNSDLVTIRITAEDQPLGIMGLVKQQNSLSWTSDEVALLHLVGQVYSNTVHRKRNLIKLRESEAKYRKLYDTAMVGLYQVSMKSRKLIEANDTLAQILDYKNSEELKAGFLLNDHFLMLEDQPDILRVLRDTGKMNHLEVHCIGNNGVRKILEISAVTDLRRRIVEGTVIDASFRKLAESRQRRLIQLIENTNEFIGLANTFGEMIYLNQFGMKLVGLSTMEEVREKTIFEFLPPDKQSALTDIVENELTLTDYIRGESVIRHFQTNEEIDIDYTGFIVLDKQTGQADTLAIVIRDITKQQQQQQKILDEIHFSETVINSLPGVFYLFDDTGRLLRWNNNLLNVTHIAADEIEFADFRKFVYKKDLPKLYKAVRRILKSGFSEIELVIRLKNNLKRPYKLTGMKLDIGNQHFFLGVGLDISELQESKAKLQEYSDHLEEMVQERTNELQEKQAQLVHSGRLAALGEMAAGVAHELNQPLAIIQAQVELLKLGVKKNKTSSEKTVSDFNLILNQVTRASEIIDHMRGFARQKAGRKPLIRINEPIEQSLDFFREQFRNHSIKLDVQLENDIPPIHLNPNQLEQIIVNFLSNARYAVNKRKLQTEPGQFQPNVTVATSYNLENTCICIEITDNGIGMNDHEKEHCLDPFFTTKDVGEGTGLGLSIVHSIVKDFNGKLHVDSRPFEFTTMRVIIPLKEDSQK